MRPQSFATIGLLLTFLLVQNVSARGTGIPMMGAIGLLNPSASLAHGDLEVERLNRIEARLTNAVEAGEIAGGSALVAQHGSVVYRVAVGDRHRKDGLPMTEDTIVRIASMTKPITSVAVMMLVENDRIGLQDPVSKYLPEFGRMTVLQLNHGESNDDPEFTIVPTSAEITIEQLLTHTAGLSYRFFNRPFLAEMYVKSGVSDGLAETPGTIGQNAWRLAQVPLYCEPGTAWEYSLATDVLGRVVEVVSGLSLAQFFRTRIFEPLGMEDTSFVVPVEKRKRLAAVYGIGPDGQLESIGRGLQQRGPLVFSTTYSTWDDGRYYSGGAGLASTLDDYYRFLQMLLNRGESNGVRLLQPETVDLMTRNQVDGLEVPDWGHGTGFGYGFGVVRPEDKPEDWAVGSYSWGGFFFTYFWVDPQNDLIGILMTQTYPSGKSSLRDDIRRITYDAMAD